MFYNATAVGDSPNCEKLRRHKTQTKHFYVTKQTISTYASEAPIQKFTHLNAFYQQYSQPRVIDSAGVSRRLFAAA
jgi:hypothetical protein